MEALLQNAAVGICLSILAYSIGTWIRKKTGSTLANPLFLSVVMICLLITYSPLTLEGFQVGGSIIILFIVPATTCLALQIHRQWKALGENILPVLCGCLVGSLTSVVSIQLLCRAFLLDDTLTASLLPKSVTTAIALELSEKGGGIGAITVSAVLFTGVTSAVVSPLLLKLLRWKNPVATGVALGTSGHALATARAIELGETEGAMSGIALTFSGILTSLLFLVLPL